MHDVTPSVVAMAMRMLTNDLETEYEEIVVIYKARWAIGALFKQIKQNFPLRYFYGKSANAIKIQVWVTLIANMLIRCYKRASAAHGVSQALPPSSESC